MWLKSIARRLALALSATVGLYLTAAAVLARVPVNDAWRAPERGIRIYVFTNGVHTGVVLPAGRERWRAYGWGDRDVYLNTPRWRDLRPGVALRALTGRGSTLVHVDTLGPFAPDDNWRPMVLRPIEYARLRGFVAATFVPGGRAIPGYGDSDRFYPARGRYSAIVTCNEWTRRALARAGVRTGAWTPFAWDVMRWVPRP